MTHGNTRILLIIMPNSTGHTDSIKNSQFKAAWQSGPTRTIRVPIALAEITLEYARQLDQGVEPRDTSKVSKAGSDNSNVEPHDTSKVSKAGSDNSNVEPRDTSKVSKAGSDNSNVEPRDTSNERIELAEARANYVKLLESSTIVTNKLRQEVQEVRSQLETERADREEVETQLTDREAKLAELRSELSDLKQNSATASDLFGKVSELSSLFKTLLPKNAKLPGGTIAKIEKILGGKND